MLTLMPGQTGSLGDDKFQQRGMLIDTQVPRLDNCDKMETEQHVCWHDCGGWFPWYMVWQEGGILLPFSVVLVSA